MKKSDRIASAADADSGARLLAAIARQARSTAGKQFPKLDIAAFVRNYYRSVALEDLSARSVENLAGAALAQLRLGRIRRAGETCVRVYNPSVERDGWTSPHTIVELVHDDMPFLVDSTTMTLNRLGHGIHLTVHPVLGVARTARGQLSALAPRDAATPRLRHESFIHFEVMREPALQRHDELEQALRKTLVDVRAAIEDWQQMLAKLRIASIELPANASMLPPEIVQESCQLLQWMAEDHFTLLGYREYRLDRRGKARLLSIPGTGLGILRDNPDDGPTQQVLNAQMQRVAESPEPLVITKANARSTVHRPGYLDYIGVKVFDARGRPVRERRFLGLYTSAAYNRQPRDIPLLRQKIRRVLELAGVTLQSHRGKALQHILDTYPRDELFQTPVQDLHRITQGIVNLQERHKVRLLVRREDFMRYYSCLVFAPRDRYRTAVRLRIEQILREELCGDQVDSRVEMSESVLARVHVIVRSSAESTPRRSFEEIEQMITEAVTTWQDRLREVMLDRFEEGHGNELFQRYCRAFPAAYREDVTPREASFDIERVHAVLSGEQSMATSLYRAPRQAEGRMRFKICQAGEPLSLSRVVPMLENMGLEVLSERPYRLRLQGTPVFVQDLDLTPQTGRHFDPASCGERFQQCFRETLAGRVENDGHNRLVLLGQLDYRQVVLLRACTKYLVQSGMPFSQAYMQEVLIGSPVLAVALVNLFASQLDPDLSARARSRLRTEAETAIDACLETVTSLDEDRILRGYLGVVRAALRSNFYQRDAAGAYKDYISIKLDPSQLTELPKPRPQYEIFVYSTRMEGVHLRAGSIARGGLRWSDRREDFRSEVLGLMKAQQVKNTVIVPNGAKGGFVCKRLPEDGDRQEIQREVRHCYSTLIRGMLDITDNYVDKQIQPPPRVRRLDGDDPYLVVAADKGTATFSDLANQIAAEYDFWLGDAFASGGSNGYDHKKMGITAKGAWEAVKRHFLELGIDANTDAISVVGIGDMSGDVFGNGMLQSSSMRLIAAFDHRHVFIDPDPDPEKSYAERKRLFALPSSSWEDYDRSLISAGGGVYSRASKSIRLSSVAAELLGVSESGITAPEVIQAVLKLQVDLLWNGGIGTYVKAASEAHEDVGDRSNNAVRVNGRDLRCKVIGEGGNLGLTQRGRIEYALKGGRCNTDFIDNSGGVECSDREVNIKILLREAVGSGKLGMSKRNSLLEGMTDEVAELVLRTNYQQAQAISVMSSRSLERIDENASLLRWLERTGLLDRALEFLPNDEEIAERRSRGRGMTRPELAVILAYAKIAQFDALCASDVSADPSLAEELLRYFPAPLRKRFAPLMPEHRLATQIITMLISSSMINRMGPAFPMRAQEETGSDAASVARAYTIAREVIGMREIWENIEALDGRVSVPLQLDMLFDSARQLRIALYWFLRHHQHDLDIAQQTRTMRADVAAIMQNLPALMPGVTARGLEEATQALCERGAPETLARQVAALPYSIAALDIVEVARHDDRNLNDAARAYFELGRALKLDWLKHEIEKLSVEGRWQALGRGTLRGAVHDQQRHILQRCLVERGRAGAELAVAEWLKTHRETVVKVLHILTEMQASKQVDFATLSVALEEVRRLGVAS